MKQADIQAKVKSLCRRLLSEQNRDPYTPTYGCFDRRFWSWKLIDFPEATFQRNVYPLAWLLSHETSQASGMSRVLTEAVIAGLRYTEKLQHNDGSFDQAFPNEHSFGATAFLLHPLLASYRIVREFMSPEQRASQETCLRQGADFLCTHNEAHGHIANHLSGAVLALMDCADFLCEPRYERRAQTLLNHILDHKSSEGWFLEYEGADPGYQTLAIHYLSQVYYLRPDERLLKVLKEAVEFISWFIHPDGTFGGEYGSRRTAIYYPGGLALLQKDIPLAAAMTQFMLQSIRSGRTVTLDDIDMGNIAPLLSSYILLIRALDSHEMESSESLPTLAWQENACKDFPEAGLFIRGSRKYYAVLGVSNGGVLKVFHREKQTLLWDDGGYVGLNKKGERITTQVTDLGRKCQAGHDRIDLQSSFYYMNHDMPTPLKFVILRILNLTVMRSIWLGNKLKGLLVHLLISGKREAPLRLSRTIIFEKERVIIQDKLVRGGEISLTQMDYGTGFTAIHMASSRYFQGNTGGDQKIGPLSIDVDSLNEDGVIQIQVVV